MKRRHISSSVTCFKNIFTLLTVRNVEKCEISLVNIIMNVTEMFLLFEVVREMLHLNESLLWLISRNILNLMFKIMSFYCRFFLWNGMKIIWNLYLRHANIILIFLDMWVSLCLKRHVFSIFWWHKRIFLCNRVSNNV
jgi:hypothetical protein